MRTTVALSSRRPRRPSTGCAGAARANPAQPPRNMTAPTIAALWLTSAPGSRPRLGPSARARLPEFPPLRCALLERREAAVYRLPCSRIARKIALVWATLVFADASRRWSTRPSKSLMRWSKPSIRALMAGRPWRPCRTLKRRAPGEARLGRMGKRNGLGPLPDTPLGYCGSVSSRARAGLGVGVPCEPPRRAGTNRASSSVSPNRTARLSTLERVRERRPYDGRRVRYGLELVEYPARPIGLEHFVAR